MARNRMLSELHTLLVTLVTNSTSLEDSSVDTGPLQIVTPQDILDNIWKKLDYLVHILPNFLAYLGDKFGEIFHDLVCIVPNFFAYLGDKFNEIFPPEMRREAWQWILTALPFVVGGLILLVCVYFFLGCLITLCGLVLRGLMYIGGMCGRCIMSCCRCLAEGVKFICCCGGRGGGNLAVRLMVAPGRGGVMMARSVFEAAPKLYFQTLRAGLPLS